MKTSKKILSTLLAATMALGMSVTAFADETPAANTAKAGSEMKLPTLQVTVGTIDNIKINPYKLKIQVDSTDVTDSIIGSTGYITNESACAVKVDVTVTGNPTTGVTLSSKALTAKDTGKALFLYTDFQKATDADGTTPLTWAAYDAKSATQVLVGTKATTKTVGTMAVGDTTATYMAFHVGGEANGNSTVAWAQGDGVEVTFAFTFTPTATVSAA